MGATFRTVPTRRTVWPQMSIVSRLSKPDPAGREQPELSELLDKGLWPAACQGAQGSTLTTLISSIQGGGRGFGSGIFNLNWHHSCLSSNSKMTLPQLGENIVAQDSWNPARGKAPRIQGQPYQSQGQWACPSPLQLFPCLSSLPPGGRQLPTAGDQRVMQGRKCFGQQNGHRNGSQGSLRGRSQPPALCSIGLRVLTTYGGKVTITCSLDLQRS